MWGSLRRALYLQLDPTAWPQKGLSPVNWALVVTIVVASLTVIVATEPIVRSQYATWLTRSEVGFAIIFTAEYLARLWTAAEAGSAPWRARLQFAGSFSGLIDLAVVVASLTPLVTADLAVLRLVRLIRIAQLAKLGRMSAAMSNLRFAIHSRRYELGLTVGLALFLLVFGASALYWLESDLQPAKFGSVPRALWWAVITMTTIGYGDVYPITLGGKIVASLVAVAGIGLIAMPTGILAAAFSDAIQQRNESD